MYVCSSGEELELLQIENTSQRVAQRDEYVLTPSSTEGASEEAISKRL